MLKLSLEAIKERMFAKGARFPISARDASKFRDVGPLAIQVLRRNGLLLPDFTEGLSVRARNCLFNMDISTKEEAKKAIDDYVIHPGTPRNFGKATYREVCTWAGAACRLD